jgi:tripartite-type tricarboxylate transporter receptor subunit TctC
MNHIPYKGGNAPMLALLAGEVPVLFSSVAGMAPQVESGKVRMLAVTTKRRYAPLPNVPTVAETVLPDFDALAWYALAAPKNLPAPLVARLNEFALATLKRPDVADKIRGQGAEVWGTSPREAQEFLAAEVARWTRVIREANVQSAN